MRGLSGRAIFLGLGILCLDQAAKYFVHSNSDAFKSFLRPLYFLEPSFNGQGPFSWPIGNYVLLMGGIVTVGAILFSYSRLHPTGEEKGNQERQEGFQMTISLILGAGLSNLIDRFSFGAIREIAHFGNLAFNLADVVIIAGSAMILIHLIKWKDVRKPYQKAE